MGLVVFAILLWIVAAIWLGIRLEHVFLVPVIGFIVFIISICIALKIDHSVISIIIVFLVPVIILAVLITSNIREAKEDLAIKEKKQEAEENKKSLLNAVKFNDITTAKELIEVGTDVNITLDNRSLIQIAVDNNSEEMVSLLIESGAAKQILEKNKYDINTSILKNAVKNNNEKIVSLLIKIMDDRYDSEKLLLMAVENGDKNIVSLLVKNKSHIDSLYNGNSLLEFTDNEEIIEILKQHGVKTKAELDKETEERATEQKKRQEQEENQQKLNDALSEAILFNKTDSINNLISQGANDTLANKIASKKFIKACENGNLEFVRNVLEHNKSFANTEDEDGNIPLIQANANRLNRDMTKLLLDYGANVNAMDRSGCSVLLAITGDFDEDVDLVRLLINAGANVNAKWFALGAVLTPLKYARGKKHYATEELLISAGAIE